VALGSVWMLRAIFSTLVTWGLWGRFHVPSQHTTIRFRRDAGELVTDPVPGLL
jgi:hypothetical protein